LGGVEEAPCEFQRELGEYGQKDRVNAKQRLGVLRMCIVIILVLIQYNAAGMLAPAQRKLAAPNSPIGIIVSKTNITMTSNNTHTHTSAK
jgi:hypothetical protein